jgi:hypothetical protein
LVSRELATAADSFLLAKRRCVVEPAIGEGTADVNEYQGEENGNYVQTPGAESLNLPRSFQDIQAQCADCRDSGLPEQEKR